MNQFRNQIDIRIKCISKIGEPSSYVNKTDLQYFDKFARYTSANHTMRMIVLNLNFLGQPMYWTTVVLPAWLSVCIKQRGEDRNLNVCVTKKAMKCFVQKNKLRYGQQLWSRGPWKLIKDKYRVICFLIAMYKKFDGGNKMEWHQMVVVYVRSTIWSTSTSTFLRDNFCCQT